MILNLKRVNFDMVYHHFKMDTLLCAVAMMRTNCFMASTDLKHAYYSVPIHPEDHMYFKFQWNSQFYQYTVFPNGLSSCLRQFTKLMKAVYSTLQKQSFETVSYLDDSFLNTSTFSECANNEKVSETLLKSLGFVIHQDKSVLVSTQKLIFLGFCTGLSINGNFPHSRKSNECQRSLYGVLIPEHSLYKTS